MRLEYFLVLLTISVSLASVCPKIPSGKLAPKDTCVYWFPSEIGFEINGKLLRYGLGYSLHGWFPAATSNETNATTTAETFLSTTNLTQFEPTIFVSTTPGPLFEISCSHYHQFRKHGERFGYSYATWTKQIRDCSIRFPIDRDFLGRIRPHICAFDRKSQVNCVIAGIKGELAEKLVGCKPGRPFTICDGLSKLEYSPRSDRRNSFRSEIHTSSRTSPNSIFAIFHRFASRKYA